MFSYFFFSIFTSFLLICLCFSVKPLNFFSIEWLGLYAIDCMCDGRVRAFTLVNKESCTVRICRSLLNPNHRVNQTLSTWLYIWQRKQKVIDRIYSYEEKKIAATTMTTIYTIFFSLSLFLFVWKLLSMHSSFLNAIKLPDYVIGSQKP